MVCSLSINVLQIYQMHRNAHICEKSLRPHKTPKTAPEDKDTAAASSGEVRQIEMLLWTVVLSVLAASSAKDINALQVSNLRKLSVTAPAANPAVRDGVLMADLDGDKCTSIAVGPKAGSEGPMNTHTSDCGDCDFRINKVHSLIQLQLFPLTYSLACLGPCDGLARGFHASSLHVPGPVSRSR
jgi:hypothetical protein